MRQGGAWGPSGEGFEFQPEGEQKGDWNQGQDSEEKRVEDGGRKGVAEGKRWETYHTIKTLSGWQLVPQAGSEGLAIWSSYRT